MPTLAAIVAAACWAADAPALGLGEVVQQSALGHGLRLVIPIIAAPDEDLSGECFKLVSSARDADGVPQVTSARLALETTPAGSRLVITSSRSINDPVVRVSVRAGCDVSVQRDYTLLMDPLPIEAPTVAAESAAPREAAVAPARSDAGAAAGGVGRRGTAGAQGSSRGGGGAGAAVAAPGARAAAKPRAKAPRKAAGPSTVVVPPPKPIPEPEKAQLKLSRALPGGSRDAGAPQEPAAPLPTLQSQEDLANALEAETVVLRQRVAELSQSIERMQQEMAAAQAAQAARLAAEEAAKASPWRTALRWWEGNWPFLVALVVAALIAAGLLYRRRRNSSVAEWPIGGLPEDRFESTYMGTAVPGVNESAGPRGAEVDTSQDVAAAAKPARGNRGAGDAAGALAVSELSQVTEEARVFLQLGHVDRAINVLSDHIVQQPRSMPAAWLMLLDLYRTHGRENDFRKLADEFHLHFNARTPEWSRAAPADAGDAGLEGFPHIVRQLTASWGTQECRELIDQLLYDNRKGRRAGFSFRAFTEILTLRQLLELVLVDVESDVDEERKVRAAWAAATGRPAAASVTSKREPVPARAGEMTASPANPMTLDLDLDLGRDGTAPGRADPKSPRK